MTDGSQRRRASAMGLLRSPDQLMKTFTCLPPMGCISDRGAMFAAATAGNSPRELHCGAGKNDPGTDLDHEPETLDEALPHGLVIHPVGGCLDWAAENLFRFHHVVDGQISV